MATSDDDVVEIHPSEEPTRRTGRSIAIAAGVCVLLLIIAVTTYSMRSDGGGPDRPDPSPPDQYFAIDRMDELTSAPIGHLAGRKLHYLRLVNDGSAGFGICGGDGVLHFTVEDGIVSRTMTTSEECYNGFDMTHDLRTLVSQLASAPATGLVEVEIESHNRLTPLITVTRDGQPTTYGIDAIAVGPTQTNVGNPRRQAYAVDRLRAASGINTVYAVCAWLDTNTISITGATAEAVAPVQTWEYVGTPVLTREYAAETKGSSCRPATWFPTCRRHQRSRASWAAPSRRGYASTASCTPKAHPSWPTISGPSTIRLARVTRCSTTATRWWRRWMAP